MSRKDDCWDKAVAKILFATLKREAIRTSSVQDYDQDLYNTRRRHFSISYQSPIEFELIHVKKKRSS